MAKIQKKKNKTKNYCEERTQILHSQYLNSFASKMNEVSFYNRQYTIAVKSMVSVARMSRFESFLWAYRL